MLISCVECGKQISDRATECPKCGAPVVVKPRDDTGISVVPEASAVQAAAPTSEVPPSHERTTTIENHRGGVGSRRTGRLVLAGFSAIAIAALMLGWRFISPSFELEGASGNEVEAVDSGVNQSMDEMTDQEQDTSFPMPATPSQEVLRVTGKWRYGNGLADESDEGEWMLLELDAPSVAKISLLKEFDGLVHVENPSDAISQITSVTAEERMRCHFRAEGVATIELHELHLRESDEMYDERVGAKLVTLSNYRFTKNPPEECTKPLTLEDAFTSLRAEIERDPSRPELWAKLGRALTVMGDYKDALDAFTSAVKLAPDDPVLLVEAAEARATANSQSLFDEQAVAWLRHALEVDPKHQRAIWFLGISQRQQGRAAEAARTWESLLAYVDEETAQSLRVQIEEARADADQRISTPTSAPTQAARAAPAQTLCERLKQAEEDVRKQCNSGVLAACREIAAHVATNAMQGCY